MNFEIATWKDVKQDVSKKNNELYKAIESIDKADKFKLVRAKYRFGDDIIERGDFKVRINDQLISYNQAEISKEIRELLNYNWSNIPFGIVANNSTESYIDHSTHIVPFRLLLPGKTFSLLSVFEDNTRPHYIPSLLNTKAGCRSLLILPKITHAASNERLAKKFQIPKKYLAPKNFYDQWYLFKEIIRSQIFDSDWHTELLYFSKDFINEKSNTLHFRHELMQRVWRSMAYRRHQVTYEFVWSIFMKYLPPSLKHDSIVVETVKHLILIAMGEAPGYIPEHSNLSAPISQLTDVFLKCYRIRYHLPIFMRLEHYDNKNPLYYSIQKHSFIHEIQNSYASRHTISELLKIKKTLSMFIDYILNNKFEHDASGTALFHRLAETDFDFFHPNADEGINSNIVSLANFDQRFLNFPHSENVNANLTFPDSSIFFHGCIRIKPKYSKKKDN